MRKGFIRISSSANLETIRFKISGLYTAQLLGTVLEALPQAVNYP
jgi:hypothetical protein